MSYPRKQRNLVLCKTAADYETKSRTKKNASKANATTSCSSNASEDTSTLPLLGIKAPESPRLDSPSQHRVGGWKDFIASLNHWVRLGRSGSIFVILGINKPIKEFKENEKLCSGLHRKSCEIDKSLTNGALMDRIRYLICKLSCLSHLRVTKWALLVQGLEITR